MSEIFCGIGKVPAKSRLGSMKECAEKKQIRYYGVKKVDPKILEIALGTKKDKNTAFPWHHPKFNIDENSLSVQAKVLSQIAQDYLQK